MQIRDLTRSVPCPNPACGAPIEVPLGGIAGMAIVCSACSAEIELVAPPTGGEAARSLDRLQAAIDTVGARVTGADEP